MGAIVKGAVVEVEKFHASGTRILGAMSVVIAVVFAVEIASDGLNGRDGLLICLIGLASVLAWAAMVRPQVRLEGDCLYIRDMLSSVSLPVAGVESVEIRKVVVVRAGGRKFVSAAVSKSRSQVIRDNRGVARDATAYPNFVEDRIRARSEDERAKQGKARGEVPLDVRRKPAWPELVLLAIFAIGAVVFLFV